MESIKIIYSKASKKFLDKNKNIISESKVDEFVVKSVKKVFYKQDINIDIARMANYKPIHYRIRYRDIRIIISIQAYLSTHFLKTLNNINLGTEIACID
jgi:hypothetical protein